MSAMYFPPHLFHDSVGRSHDSAATKFTQNPSPNSEIISTISTHSHHTQNMLLSAFVYEIGALSPDDISCLAWSFSEEGTHSLELSE